MLGKLFKYDWKSFWKVPAAINIFLLIITAIGAISMASPLWKLDYDLINVLLVLSILFYYLALFAGSIAIFVYIAVRYYKNVYSDEGYLTNTLPVTPREIILSKMFVGAIWTIITSVVIFFSVIILLICAAMSFGDAAEWAEIYQVFRTQVLPFFRNELGMSIGIFLLLTIVSMIVGTFLSILMLYSSVSLGQLFTKHKVAGAVIWYIAQYTILQFGTSIIMNIPLIGVFSSTNVDVFFPDGTFGTFIKAVLGSSIVLSAIVSVALFFITEYMLKKKLNLE